MLEHGTIILLVILAVGSYGLTLIRPQSAYDKCVEAAERDNRGYFNTTTQAEFVSALKQCEELRQ